MAKEIDTRIDALYRLPLDEFTAARNALAKETGDASVKQLTKPPVAAWAVNQLYWDRRDDYDALVDAATEMRRTHKSVIEGRKGDLRAASREHDHAIEAALKATIELLKARGHAMTDAIRHAVLNTLRSLPAADPPGRLARVLSPGGLEMLAGLTPAPREQRTKETKQTKATKGTKPEGQPAKVDKTATANKAAARQKAERDAAERAVRDAEHHARRTEFELARAAREASKAEKHLESIRTALERAREALEEAERDVTVAEREAAAAGRARETAERKARDAEAALSAARGRLD